MSEQEPEGYKDGECGRCGNVGYVFEDNSLCEDCDSHTVHCKICDCRVHIEDRCRHVFKDSDFEWTGSGAYAPSAEVKASFFKLLDLMPAGFAPDLKSAIEAEAFHTWLVAPLIGGGGSLQLYGMPRRDDKSDWGERLIEIGEGEAAEETADGYHWLASLYNGDTAEANRLTTTWLDEWMAAP